LGSKKSKSVAFKNKAKFPSGCAATPDASSGEGGSRGTDNGGDGGVNLNAEKGKINVVSREQEEAVVVAAADDKVNEKEEDGEDAHGGGGQLMVVLEDDAVLLVDKTELAALVESLSNFDGVAFLGYHARQQPSALEAWDLALSTANYDDEDSGCLIDAGLGDGRGRARSRNDGSLALTCYGGKVLPSSQSLGFAPMSKAAFLGGTFAYVISAKQASRYLAVLATKEGRFDQKQGTFAVDHFMRVHTDVERWWGAAPLRVVHSDFAYVRGGQGMADSDIAIQ